jgi:hypothetical protein
MKLEPVRDIKVEVVASVPFATNDVYGFFCAAAAWLFLWGSVGLIAWWLL